MKLTRTTLFGLSKAFPRVRAPATLPASTGKVSLGCFASSVSHSEGRDLEENARDSMADVDYGSKKWRENTGENYAQAAKDKVHEKAKDSTEQTKGKVNEEAYKAADKAEDTKERAKDYDVEDTIDNAKEKVKEYGEDTKERAKGFKETVKGKAEELGEKTKETVKGAWESTKNGAQTVTEAVVAPEEDADKARAEKDTKEDDFITFK